MSRHGLLQNALLTMRVRRIKVTPMECWAYIVCACACNIQKQCAVTATSRRASALRTSVSRKSVFASLSRRQTSPPPSVMAAQTHFPRTCFAPVRRPIPRVTWSTSSSSSRSSGAAPRTCAITSPAVVVGFVSSRIYVDMIQLLLPHWRWWWCHDDIT